MSKFKNILIALLIISNLGLLLYFGLSMTKDSMNSRNNISKVSDSIYEKTQKILDTLKKNPNAYLDDEKLKLIMPKGDSLMIYNNGIYIPVNNFYKYAHFIMKDSSAVFFENDDYTLSYSAPWKTFHIVIHSEKIIKSVYNAENKFLEVLKINEFQACSMNVKIGIDKGFQDYARDTPYYLNQYDMLSFCGYD